MLKNKFEAKMYLKWLLWADRNNSVKEVFKDVCGYTPLSAYEVITNETYLEWNINSSQNYDIEEWGIDKKTIKWVLQLDLKKQGYYL